MESKHRLIAWMYISTVLIAGYFIDDYYTKRMEVYVTEMTSKETVALEQEKTKRLEILRDAVKPSEESSDIRVVF